MNRLHPDTLVDVNWGVQLPPYDRAALRPGIVHLGLGAFHRAHQAVYTEQAIANSGGDWGIVGVSLRSGSVARQLLPQGGLYSVMIEDAAGPCLQVVGAILDVLVAPEEPARVVAAIASQDVKLVSLTITEKGYCLAADGSSLNTADEIVCADLADPENPSSAVGILALGLRERLRAGGAPLTILSCDNLSENSRRLRGVLTQYLAQAFTEVLPWLDEGASFPCSMVDRIVPAMTDEQRRRQATLLGLCDEGAVSTEPFRQWIIEDSFAAERPDWPSAGVQLVENVVPYENIKLRLLNASHSAIAYCGLLAGLDTVDEVMADQQLRSFVQRLMAEDLMPALDVPTGFDLAAYRDELELRFSNPCLDHRCKQIGMDGSEKISQRWLPTLQDSPGARNLVLALGTWCHFVLSTQLPIDDPAAERLLKLRASTEGIRVRLEGVLACARISAETVGHYGGLVQELLQHLDSLADGGVRKLLSHHG